MKTLSIDDKREILRVVPIANSGSSASAHFKEVEVSNSTNRERTAPKVTRLRSNAHGRDTIGMYFHGGIKASPTRIFYDREWKTP